jgi:RNA-directed DNA polymerase
LKDRIRNDIGELGQALDWESIDWNTVERKVKNLRQRIFRATRDQKWNQVRSLMKLMIRSYSNLLSSVRKVTQLNDGRKTAGVDNQLVLNDSRRVALVKRLSKYKLWNCSPARRVQIPKAGGKTRPLGILTVRDRVAQAILKNALEPSWECRFESHSYGFRPGRSCHDAVMQCWLRLNGRHKDSWVLDADIKGAFDNISHSFILDKIGKCPGRELIKQWLKAGYVEAEVFHATINGVPQGGVISPLLANIALDGMQSLLGGKMGFIRYADDFVVTARTKEQLLAIRPIIEEWLAERGLTLNTEKTKVVSINDGFNFLGFSVRRYSKKCLVKPQKDKVLEFLRSIREWLKNHSAVTPEIVIRHLNPVLRGWAYYYRHAVSKQVFSYVDHQVWLAIWKWCLDRHQRKGTNWVKQKYFTTLDERSWVFFANTNAETAKRSRIYLINLSQIAIKRHTKVVGSACPDDPDLHEYWRTREEKKLRPANFGQLATLDCGRLEPLDG